MIAQGSPRGYLRKMRSQSGRQDSNLRPSAPKALDTPLAALRFRPITNILRSIELFVLTNHTKFDGILTEK